MKTIAIIPARMNSSRFPGKPLKKINGKEMIKIIYKNVNKNKKLRDTIIATCDKEIKSFCLKNNMKCIMTSKKHVRASDRTYEVVIKYEKLNKIRLDLVVMVQGDEPMVDKKMIDMSIKPFKNNKKVKVVNLISKIYDKKIFKDQNCIKVVKKIDGNALYFSRKSIPFKKLSKNYYSYKQVCIIPFERDFLFKYLNLKETNLEISESIDMMRVLEHGYDVKLVEIKKETFPVDTLNDLKKVSRIMK